MHRFSSHFERRLNPVEGASDYLATAWRVSSTKPPASGFIPPFEPHRQQSFFAYPGQSTWIFTVLPQGAVGFHIEINDPKALKSPLEEATERQLP